MFEGKKGEFLEATLSTATDDVTVEVVEKEGEEDARGHMEQTGTVILSQKFSGKRIR